MAIFGVADLLPWRVGIAGVADRVVGGRCQSRRSWASSWWVVDLGWLAATPEHSRATTGGGGGEVEPQVAPRGPLWVGGGGAVWAMRGRGNQIWAMVNHKGW
jgi:hypothetical protein